MTVSAPSRMTKSGEEGLLTIVTTFVSEIYFFSVQSENPTFLGVRSTNPLPAASGLVKLTKHEDAKYVYKPGTVLLK